MTTTRSKCCIAIAVGIASAASIAIAAEPGKKTETRAVAPPMKPGPDGWYDASPPDNSFNVRMPGVYRGFAQDGTSDAGALTYIVGVRAILSAAFGGQTDYVASCIQHEGDKRNPKERLQAIIDRWDERGGTKRYRKYIPSESQPGFEFEFTDDVKVLRARLYAPAAGTCTLLVTWRPAAKPSDADIEKFFGSFALTKR
jgi:hypothetical protein